MLLCQLLRSYSKNVAGKSDIELAFVHEVKFTNGLRHATHSIQGTYSWPFFDFT